MGRELDGTDVFAHLMMSVLPSSGQFRPCRPTSDSVAEPEDLRDAP
ncbi:MAG: hypothetical protein M3228_05715 [Actinomycetota bacterium]|nr:hypothetical protein [Actinomycetota bacterium]